MGTDDFRTAQVLGDLDRIIASGRPSDPWVIALDAAAVPDQVLLASACILRDAIATGAAVTGLGRLWLDRSGTFKAAPPPVRAALMNGVDYLRLRGLVAETCAPRPEGLITHPQARIAAALIAVARRMTPKDIDHIARADYGCDVDRHRKALATLLADDQLAYPPREFWCPAEVVELVSHTPGEPGHVACLAIVLLDALRSGDHRGNAEYRFANQFADIAKLEPEARACLYAAFRHLYESCRDWGDWPSDYTRSGARANVTIPWTDIA